MRVGAAQAGHRYLQYRARMTATVLGAMFSSLRSRMSAGRTIGQRTGVTKLSRPTDEAANLIAASTSSRAMADLDGDGFLDIVFCNRQTDEAAPAPESYVYLQAGAREPAPDPCL